MPSASLHAARIWNNFLSLRQSPSLPAFKTSLKTYLFEQYFSVAQTMNSLASTLYYSPALKAFSNQ